MDSMEAGATQQQPFTEGDVSQMHEKVRELAQQVIPKERLAWWLGELDSELQKMSALQERGIHLKKVQEKLEAKAMQIATPALAAMVAKGEAHAEAEAKKARAGVASKEKSINGRGPKRSALIKRIFSKTVRMRKRGPGAVDSSQSIRPSAEAAGRLHSATV